MGGSRRASPSPGRGDGSWSSVLRARASAAGVGVRGGRTRAPGWPGPREGPRRGARRAIVWAGAPGAVVVCARAELCAAPAPWSPGGRPDWA